MEQRFIAKSKQREKSIIGVWEDVCDLDKRLWDVRRWESEDIANDFHPEPLTTLKMVAQRAEDGVAIYVHKEIYSHQDLVGVYLG